MSKKKIGSEFYSAPLSIDEWEELVYGPEAIDEVVQKVDGKWALVSKKTKKPLAYYHGDKKPPEEWVAKQERRIQFFKSRGV